MIVTSVWKTMLTPDAADMNAFSGAVSSGPEMFTLSIEPPTLTGEICKVRDKARNYS